MFDPLKPGDPRPDELQTAPSWRFDGTGGMRLLPLRPAKVANGLAFSPDGRTLYHGDTAQKCK